MIYRVEPDDIILLERPHILKDWKIHKEELWKKGLSMEEVNVMLSSGELDPHKQIKVIKLDGSRNLAFTWRRELDTEPLSDLEKSTSEEELCLEPLTLYRFASHFKRLFMLLTRQISEVETFRKYAELKFENRICIRGDEVFNSLDIQVPENAALVLNMSLLSPSFRIFSRLVDLPRCCGLYILLLQDGSWVSYVSEYFFSVYTEQRNETEEQFSKNLTNLLKMVLSAEGCRLFPYEREYYGPPRVLENRDVADEFKISCIILTIIAENLISHEKDAERYYDFVKDDMFMSNMVVRAHENHLIKRIFEQVSSMYWRFMTDLQSGHLSERANLDWRNLRRFMYQYRYLTEGGVRVTSRATSVAHTLSRASRNLASTSLSISLPTELRDTPPVLSERNTPRGIARIVSFEEDILSEPNQINATREGDVSPVTVLRRSLSDTGLVSFSGNGLRRSESNSDFITGNFSVYSRITNYSMFQDISENSRERSRRYSQGRVQRSSSTGQGILSPTDAEFSATESDYQFEAEHEAAIQMRRRENLEMRRKFLAECRKKFSWIE